MFRVRDENPPDLIDRDPGRMEASRPGVGSFEVRVPAFDTAVLPVGDEEATAGREGDHPRLRQATQVRATVAYLADELTSRTEDQNPITARVGGVQVAAEVGSQAVQPVRAE